MYPDNRYPLDPDFPAVVNTQELDSDLLTVITEYLTDLTAVCNAVSYFDNGNLTLASGATITIGAVVITENAGQLLTDFLYIDTLDLGTVVISDDMVFTTSSIGTLDTDQLSVTGETYVEQVEKNALTLSQIAEPADPSEDDDVVIWLSDGTGEGDAGDLMIKIKHGGVVKTATLIDFA